VHDGPNPQNAHAFTDQQRIVDVWVQPVIADPDAWTRASCARGRACSPDRRSAISY
jgi:hypothetical protein